MLAFLTAFCFVTFLDSSTFVRLIVGAAWCAIGVLIVWCVLTSWEGRGDRADRWWYALQVFVQDAVQASGRVWIHMKAAVKRDPEEEAQEMSKIRRRLSSMSWSPFAPRRTSSASSVTVV